MTYYILKKVLGMERQLYYTDDVVKKICELGRIVIYGAGTMGRALKLCLESEVYSKKVELFLVMNKDNNPDDIDGCPVEAIDSTSINKNTTIIVALNENNLKTAVPVLHEYGFNNLILLDAACDSWSYIKGNYFLYGSHRTYMPFEPAEESAEALQKVESFSIFVAKSIYDKEGISGALALYEKYIQVGATLTDKVICDLRDDLGENISSRNRRYSELTALYWLWKHCNERYIGLSHYRRRFDINESEINWIIQNDTDVVVTIPVINTRGVGTQYGLDHGTEDWQILREEVHNHSPQYDESFSFVENQIYFYPCNMAIMKREVLDAYCEWIFPILFDCESRIGAKEDVYQNRYGGFLSERLMSIFLYHNRDKYRVCVAKRKYLSKR